MKTKIEIKKNKGAWDIIKYLIELENNDLGDYDNKHLKIRCNSNNNFPLKQELEINDLVIVIRSISHDNSECFVLKQM